MKGIYLILLMFSFGLSAQSLEEKIADEICSCLQDEKVDTTEQLDKSSEVCTNRVVVKYAKELLEVEENKNFEDYWYTIAGLLAKRCNTFLDIVKQEYAVEEKMAMSDCEDIKIGNYYYGENDKYYLTFTKNQVIENRGGGVYTTSKIEWLDKCVYKLTLQETNSRFDNVHMTENPYTFKIIENHKDYFVVQTQYIEGTGLIM